MVQCCLRAMPSAPAEAAQHGLAACTRLDVEHSGVLAWPPKHHNGRCLFAAQRARQMVEAAAAAHAADPEAAPVLRELLGALVFILDDCLVRLRGVLEAVGYCFLLGDGRLGRAGGRQGLTQAVCCRERPLLP